MANGDYDLRLLSKTASPGGGWNSTGVAQQGKSEVVAYLTSADYLAGGYIVPARRLGLEAIDFITFEVQTVQGNESGAAQLGAEYIRSTGGIMVFEDVDGGTEATNADSVVLRIFASGDSAHAAELL